MFLQINEASSKLGKDSNQYPVRFAEKSDWKVPLADLLWQKNTIPWLTDSLKSQTKKYCWLIYCDRKILCHDW
jgi:hypothetical protein